MAIKSRFGGADKSDLAPLESAPVQLLNDLDKSIPSKNAREAFRELIQAPWFKQVMHVMTFLALGLLAYLFVQGAVVYSKRISGYKQLARAVMALDNDALFPLVAEYCSAEEDYTLHGTDPPPGVVNEVMTEFYRFVNIHHDERMTVVEEVVDILGATMAMMTILFHLTHWIIKTEKKGKPVENDKMGSHKMLGTAIKSSSTFLSVLLMVRLLFVIIDQHTSRTVLGRCKGLDIFLQNTAVGAAGFVYQKDMNHVFFDSKVEHSLDTITWIAVVVYAIAHYHLIALVDNTFSDAVLSVVGLGEITHMASGKRVAKFQKRIEDRQQRVNGIDEPSAARSRRSHRGHSKFNV